MIVSIAIFAVLFIEFWISLGVSITNKEKKEGKDLYVVLDSSNFGKEEYGIGAKSSDTFLISKINEALKELKEDGTYNKIHDKWFGAK